MLMQRLCSYSQRPFGEPGNVKTVGWSESPTLPVGTKPTMDSRCEFVVWAPNHNYVKLCKSFRARLCRRSFRTASGPLVVAAYPKARQRRSAPARKCARSRCSGMSLDISGRRWQMFRAVLVTSTSLALPLWGVPIRLHDFSRMVCMGLRRSWT